MIHLTLVESSTYQTAILIKESALKLKELQEYYPIDWNTTIGLSLTYDSSNKAPVSLIKESLPNILKACKHFQVKTLFVCDTAYFKTLTKLTKAEPHYGSIVKCAITGYAFDVILCPNYQALFYNPSIKSKIDLAISTLQAHNQGTHIALGSNIIQFEAYPNTLPDIQEWLQKLSECPILACDIETMGLSLAEADLLSISFSWSQHEGIAFPVSQEVKPILRDWFKSYQGKLIFHNASFDCTNLVFRLFMQDYLDYEGLLEGLDVFSNIEDTKIIVYLATNSTAGNDLKLKNLALEFAGNYAILDDDTPADSIPTDELLRYNLIDTLSTWYVYNKYKPVMIQDNQLDIYESLMLPSLRSIIHMQLVGFPMDYSQVKKTAKELNKIQKTYLTKLYGSQLVKDYEWILQKEAFIAKNKALKKKFIPIEEFKTRLNPNSGQQVAGLLYDYLGFPVVNTTDTGAPATDKETLESMYKQLIQQYDIDESLL